jgi:hypothetical protein
MASTPSFAISNQRLTGRRAPRLTQIAVSALVCLLGIASAFSETIACDTPEWRKEIARGFLPYHRLTRDDFPIDDKTHPKYVMYTSGFFHYNYDSECTKEGDHLTARITGWHVRSGFNRNKSSRKSWLKDAERLVNHEQGHLDINELHSRRFAHMKLDELPVGEGQTTKEALDDLRSKIRNLSDNISKENQVEQDTYDTETSHSKNRQQQLIATAAIQKRLEAAGITYANQPDDVPTDRTTEEAESPLEMLGRTLKKNR